MVGGPTGSELRLNPETQLNFTLFRLPPELCLGGISEKYVTATFDIIQFHFSAVPPLGQPDNRAHLFRDPKDRPVSPVLISQNLALSAADKKWSKDKWFVINRADKVCIKSPWTLV